LSNSLVPPLTRTQKAIYVEDEDCWIVEEKSAEELIAHGFFLSEEDADSYYIQKHKTESLHDLTLIVTSLKDCNVSRDKLSVPEVTHPQSMLILPPGMYTVKR
jgi:hypothetical protein